MGEPSDTTRPQLSLAAARRVLVAMQAEDVGAACASSTQIDGYTIERELGRGAGGVTYLARKAGSEAKIALKVLHTPLGEGRASQRAWRELDVLQQIRCPSVPRLLDFGTTDHSLYIATEYVEGVPLSGLYEHARPADLSELRERVRLLEKVARAAHSLHERGVIHRDLKPSNVIVAPKGEPFIIDLGIALIDAPDLHQTLTQDGQPVGTPAFMAPEQARGKREEISTRSDIYSLGAIGYWLCTGETPHDLAGVTLHEAIRRVGSEPGREARGISRAVPKGLGAVLGKACAGRPGDRYSSSADLASDLSRWMGNEHVHATDPGLWRRALHFAERHPAWATTALCLSIAAASLVATRTGHSYFYRLPFRVILDHEHGRFVRLESRAGPLHEWASSLEHGVTTAVLFDAGYMLEPRRRVLTVIDSPSGLDPLLSNQLCVWDADFPHRLLWHSASEPGFIAAPRSGLPPSTSGDLLDNPEAYSVQAGVVAEVFSVSPGPEIIAIHRQSFDPSAIRIYSASGEVLFEAWHWGGLGGIGEPLWLSEQRLIVVSGSNNERPRAAWGVEGASKRWPEVILAVHPELGARRQWLNPSLAREGEQAAWYRYLSPHGDADLWRTPRIRPASPSDGPVVVLCSIDAADADYATVTFGIDASGEIITRVFNDGWRQHAQTLAPLSERITLTDHPEPPMPRSD